MNTKTKLRVEKSRNCSGLIWNSSKIKILKEKDYYVIPQTLDGDAPKEFIGAYIFSKGNNFYKKNKNSWCKYIAKTAEKWYPIESVTEYLINKMGDVLGLKMNECELVICNGQIRFLSKYFLQKNELLIHGAEICGDYLNDREMAKEIAEDKKSARELFTFEFICDSLDNLFGRHSDSIKKELVKMLVYDCLVGNNDRHFYNWGVITNSKRKGKRPIFAPIYDSARGLFWNESDAQIEHIYKISRQIGSKKIANYSKNASPRVSFEDNYKSNHFDLISYIKGYDKEYDQIIKDLSSLSNEEKVVALLRNNFCIYMSKKRANLIEELIRLRFNTTRNL
jgi:hypothetical protein